MRITVINYRAFYGEHHIQLDKDGKISCFKVKTEVVKYFRHYY